MLPDETFAATVPGLRGVVASGETLEACRRDLAEVIEEWLLARAARGLPLPSIGTMWVRRGS